MGIETGALLTALGTAATTAAVGAIASYALTPKPDKAPQVAPLTPADKAPQEQKQPDYQATKDKNALAASAAGALAGNSSTLLTGSQGVAPGSLGLGVNTLLGA